MGKFLCDLDKANKDHFYHFKCMVDLSNTLNYLDTSELITAAINYCQFSMVMIKCQD